MSSLRLGRLVLGQPTAPLSETLGDPTAATGSTVTLGDRAPKALQIPLNTLISGASTLTQNQAARRQLRSMLNNSPLIEQAFIYMVYDDDPELNAWLYPDPGSLASPDGQAFKAVGLWEMQASSWWILGQRRTHREARMLLSKNVQSGLYERDTRKLVLSSDFSLLSTLTRAVLPSAVSRVSNALSGQVQITHPMPPGRDGGSCSVISGFSDSDVIAFERPESQLGISDVIVYDRNAQITAPSSGPDTLWEEVYGADWPWNHAQSGQPADIPVLDNGLVRVRYDPTAIAGFAVDVWTGSAYEMQGKMVAYRNGAVSGALSTWLNAGLYSDAGYTPDRAVAYAQMQNTADPYSSDLVLITVNRGEQAVCFELYGAMRGSVHAHGLSSGYGAGMSLVWEPQYHGAPDANDSIMTLTQSGNGTIASSAASGSGLITPGAIGSVTSFTGLDNHVSMLRCPSVYSSAGSFQHSLAVVQEGALVPVATNASDNGFTVSAMSLSSDVTALNGFAKGVLSFLAASSDQALEAEAIVNPSSTSASIVSDALASGGQMVQDTQTLAGGLTVTIIKQPTNLLKAKYRAFGRVQIDVGVTGKFDVLIDNLVVDTITFTSPASTLVWIDLGEILATADTPMFGVTAYRTAGTGAVYIDRVELFLMEDRVRTAATFSGPRDMAQSALCRSESLGALVAR